MERVLTKWELMRRSRAQLETLFSEISATLPELPEGSIELRIALINLTAIRRELVRREMTCGFRGL